MQGFRVWGLLVALVWGLLLPRVRKPETPNPIAARQATQLVAGRKQGRLSFGTDWEKGV